MTISPPEREVKAVKIVVDRDPVPTSFEKCGNPGHFSRTLAKVLRPPPSHYILSSFVRT